MQSAGDFDQLGQTKKRKRRSRWQADPDDKAILPSVIPSGLNRDQEEQYIGMCLQQLSCVLLDFIFKRYTTPATNQFFHGKFQIGSRIYV